MHPYAYTHTHKKHMQEDPAFAEMGFRGGGGGGGGGGWGGGGGGVEMVQCRVQYRSKTRTPYSHNTHTAIYRLCWC